MKSETRCSGYNAAVRQGVVCDIGIWRSRRPVSPVAIARIRSVPAAGPTTSSTHENTSLVQKDASDHIASVLIAVVTCEIESFWNHSTCFISHATTAAGCSWNNSCNHVWLSSLASCCIMPKNRDSYREIFEIRKKLPAVRFFHILLTHGMKIDSKSLQCLVLSPKLR